MRVETDPLREIDDRLDRWAYYRSSANRVPTGNCGSSLARLVAEGSEVISSTRRVRMARTRALAYRGLLKARISRHRRLEEQYRASGAIPEAEQEADLADRLQAHLQGAPGTTGQLPSASMIYGSGVRAEADYHEEEETNREVLALPAEFREVVERNYLNHLPQDENARQMGMSVSTFKRRLLAAKQSLKARLG
jgi:DNA-directed RNA polymerase specialized sigma24 family protein